jgi:glycosyltransferase involved in cell wall biosynthesis
MAASRAIVASDQGGMPELIEDGANGLLAAAASAPAFVARLERLILSGRLRQTLGAAARQTILRSHIDSEVALASLSSYRGSNARGPRDRFYE